MTLQEKVNAILNQDNLFNLFANLWERWRDESEYENINDYGKVAFQAIQKYCPEVNATYIKATKRPFGIVIKINNIDYQVSMRLSGRYLEFNVKPVKK